MDLRTHRKTRLPKRYDPNRLRRVWGDVQPKHKWRHPSGRTIAGVAVLAVIVAAGVYFGPDFVRYMKIRRM